MLRWSLFFRVPHVTECHALYHGAFYPTVKLPIDGPRPTLGGALSAKAACEAARAAAASAATAAPTEGTSASASSAVPKKQKHTLVLDIDETLIHTFRGGPDVRATSLGRDGHPKGFEDMAELNDLAERGKGTGIDVFIDQATYFKFWTRPYLQEFLEETTQLFNVVFWTAGTGPYMASIINALERQVLNKMLAGSDADASSSKIGDNTSYMYDFKKNISAIAADGTTVGELIRAADTASPSMNYYGYSRCQTMGQNYLKHIPLLGLESTDNVILMDDATRSFVFTPRSAILVDQFKKKDDSDTFLRDVMPMLRRVAASDCAARELDHWRSDAYTVLDDLDANTKKFLMACPSEVAKQKDIQIGAWLRERRTDGPIAPAALFGMDYERNMREGIDSEVAKIQGDYTNNCSGLLHLFMRQAHQQPQQE